MAGIAYLGLIGAALTYVLWFRGVARLEPAVVSSLAFQPGDGRAVGGAGPEPSAAQLVGMAVVVASVWLSQRAQRMAPAPATPPRAGLRPHVYA